MKDRLRTIAAATAALLLGAAAVSAQSWRQTNGPLGGTVVDAVEHRGEILANVGGGLYRLDPTGWRQIGTAPNGVAGMRSVGSGLIALKAGNLLRSSDGGVTWSNTGLRLTWGSIIDVDGTRAYLLSGDSLMRSDDGAASWSTIGRLPGPANGLAVVGDTLLASQVFFGENALYRSTDGGGSWTRIDAGFTPGVGGLVTVDAAGSSFIVLHAQGLFRSEDLGATWEKIADAPPQQAVSITVTEAGHVYAIASNTAYFLEGGSWKELDLSIIHAIKPTRDGALIATQTGLFRHNEAGLTSMNDGLITSTVDVFGSVDDKLFAATYGGLYRTTDEGATWVLSAPIRATRIERIGGMILALGDGLHVSTDGGETWSAMHERIINDLDMNPLTLTDLTTTDDAIFVTSGMIWGGEHGVGGGWVEGDVYRSTDTGATWRQVNNGLFHDGITHAPVYGIVDVGSTLVITTAAGPYRSTNAGATWSPAASGISFPGANRTGYLLEGEGKLYFFTGAQIFVSDDAALSWRPLPSMPDKGEVVGTFAGTMGSIAGGDLYVTTTTSEQVDSLTWKHHAWNYRFDGMSWTDVTPMNPEGVTFSAWIEHDGALYAGSRYNGVWRQELVSSVDRPGTPLVVVPSVAPNPFTSQASLRLELAVGRTARVTLADQLGREVTLLHDGPLAPGDHTFAIDGAELPAGIYLVRIESGDGVATHRVVHVD